MTDKAPVSPEMENEKRYAYKVFLYTEEELSDNDICVPIVNALQKGNRWLLISPITDEDSAASLTSQQGAAPVQGWVSVEERPLAIYETKEDGSKWWTSQIAEGDEFLAAVPYNDKRQPGKQLWWIRQCVIQDGRGLCVVCDDDVELAGWDLSDVTHWKRILPPGSAVSNISEDELENKLGQLIFDESASEVTISEAWHVARKVIEYLRKGKTDKL